MPNPVILNNETHQRLRVITARGAEYGENVHFVPVIANELRSLVLDYPVILMKDKETGRFGLHALLGFEPGENLFLDGDQWDASYIPLHIVRQPFMVGIAAEEGAEPTPDNAVISIDFDSKRVQETEGEALFSEDGERTPYLTGVSDLLSGLMGGINATEAFIDELAENDLIEPVQINVEFANGEEKSYEGLYTVHDENLKSLPGEALKSMHEKGYLQASHLLLASIGHIQKLITFKNRSLTASS